MHKSGTAGVQVGEMMSHDAGVTRRFQGAMARVPAPGPRRRGETSSRVCHRAAEDEKDIRVREPWLTPSRPASRSLRGFPWLLLRLQPPVPGNVSPSAIN